MAALAPFGDHVSVLPAALSPWFRAHCPEVPLEGAIAVLDLAAGGATVPFIARYRQERTGRLDEASVRQVVEARERFDRLVGRQVIVLESIERHTGETPPALRDKILSTFDVDRLEDLYLPYKQKKKSRATEAREAGLGHLADWIWNCGHGTETPQEGQTLELWAYTFRSPEKGVPDAKTAIEGARDILVERLAEDAELRALGRRTYEEKGWLRSTKTDKGKPGSRFEPYFDLCEKVSTLRRPAQSHRYLALRRGQSEGELLLSIGGRPDDEGFDENLVAAFEAAAVTVPESPGAEVLQQAARIAFKGLVRNAMENDVHRKLKDEADAAAARAYAARARRLLLEAPLGAKAVLGIGPGVRKGSAVAVVDGTGGLVATGAISLKSDEDRAAAPKTVLDLVREHGVEAIAIGNSDGGRETELLLRPALREAGLETLVALVTPTGASAYATGEAGKSELPDQEAGPREAVFVARRLQDPLRELVKIEPRNIVGRQHTHDASPASLLKGLAATLDSCVHDVGVDVNSAPRQLLARVSGLDPTLAAAVVEHRQAKGPFASRQGLLEVTGLGPREFEQASGFLRVPGGEHPFDATGIHPEQYAALESFAEAQGKSPTDLMGAEGASLVRKSSELETTLGRRGRDAVARQLEASGGDPRGPFTPFSFREDLQKLEDLQSGMVCPGLVTNVTTFGAFVDVGLPHDGLVHVSQLGRQRNGDPREAIQVGDRVEARVLKVDREKKQISLTLKPLPPPRRPAAAQSRGKGAAPGARPGRRDGDRRRPAPRGRPSPGAKPAHRPAPQPARERRPAFNNPFAVLADMKLPKRDKS